MNLSAPAALLWISFTFSFSGLGQSRLPALTTYDVLIRNGLIYDGSGQKPYRGDIAIRDNRVVAVGKLPVPSKAATVIDAKGMAVAPGFINVLSHTGGFLLQDSRSMSDLKQGVTTEIFGEFSWGPVRNQAVRQRINTELKYGARGDTCTWTTLEEFMLKLEHKGITPNIAAYVGAGEIRINVLGDGDVKPTPEQLAQMQALVGEAMKGGALGVTTMLIYPPYTFASTDELIALCREAARYKGRYIVHMRSEGDRLEEAIRRLTSLPATNYYLTKRGLLKAGYFADVVIFDPAKIADKATFDNPFQYAIGVQHIWINGRQVLSNGEHTGVLPGRALWGPGKKQQARISTLNHKSQRK